MKKLKVSLFILVFSFLLPIKVLAWIPLESIKPKIQIDWGTIFQTTCNNKKNKIQTRIDNFTARKEEHLETYTKLKDRLALKIEDWKNMGYDVEQLEEDAVQLQDKVQKYSNDFSSYIKELNDVLDLACEDADDYKDALQEARDALKEVRDDVRDIRQFYQNTIRPHILALRDQIPSPEGE